MLILWRFLIIYNLTRTAICIFNQSVEISCSEPFINAKSEAESATGITIKSPNRVDSSMVQQLSVERLYADNSLCTSKYDLRFDSVFWPPFTGRFVWLIRATFVYKFDLETRTIVSDYTTDKYWPGTEVEELIVGASSSVKFPGPNEKTDYYYAFLVSGTITPKILIYKHFVSNNFEISLGNLVDKFNVTCIERGLMRCVYLPDDLKIQSGTHYFYTFEIHPNDQLKRQLIACPTSITTNGSIIKLNDDTIECTAGVDLYIKYEENFTIINDLMAYDNSPRCTAVATEVSNMDNIFWIQGNIVFYRYNGLETISSFAEMFNCTDRSQSTFTLYSHITKAALIIFFICLAQLTFLIIYDLNRLSKFAKKLTDEYCHGAIPEKPKDYTPGKLPSWVFKVQTNLACVAKYRQSKSVPSSGVRPIIRRSKSSTSTSSATIGSKTRSTQSNESQSPVKLEIVGKK